MEERIGDVPLAGVEALEHTADVGLEVRAPDLPELIRRAARGLTWLLLEREPGGAASERKLRVKGGTPETLLREALRELLWWHEVEGLSLRDLAEIVIVTGWEEEPEEETEEAEEEDEPEEEKTDGGGLSLEASALLATDPDPPVREIKGVTLHGLVAERRGEGWYGRVIFDV